MLISSFINQCRARQPTPVFLPGESHRQILVGYLFVGLEEPDMTEQPSTQDITNVLRPHKYAVFDNTDSFFRNIVPSFLNIYFYFLFF